MRGQAVTHPLRMGESPSHLAPNKHIMSPCLYIRPVRKCESQTPSTQNGLVEKNANLSG